MRTKSGFVLREVAGEYMLIPVGEQSGVIDGIITLNSVAAVVWKALEEKRGKEGALEDILARYDVDAEMASSDLDQLLRRMANAGLIEGLDD